MRAVERLARYAVYNTASDESSETCPSTPAQLTFAKLLVKELRELGVKDVDVDEHGYVFATIPATIPDWQGRVIGFIAHLDLASDVETEGITPRLVKNYEGGVLILDAETGLDLDPADFPVLLDCIGHDLLVTNGKTLLGADDKAGIAEIMTLVERLQTEPGIQHGTIKIAFTPDEEIGRGAKLFDVGRFGADYAYTVDGGAAGEVEYETFHAQSAKLTIQGRNIHPGYAKGKMINALGIATEINGLMPQAERPEHTEGYEGFYHLIAIEGSVEQATMSYILRDHDADILQQRVEWLRSVAALFNQRYGDGTVDIEFKENYANMAEAIKPEWHLIENARKAIRDVGLTPVTQPVRGGTDGSQLSFMGLPCPNLGTGSFNPHGKQEFASAQQMDQCVEILLGIVKAYA